MKTWLASVLALVALGLLFLSVRSASRVDDTGLALRVVADSPPAQDFTIPDAETGKPLRLLAAAHARPVVLDFWATWCGPCRQELPHLDRVAQQYRGRVAFYGVNSNDPPATIAAFARQNGMTFPTLADTGHAASSLYGADSIPELVVVDTRGRVRLLTQGYDPEGDLEGTLAKDLDALLAGN